MASFQSPSMIVLLTIICVSMTSGTLYDTLLSHLDRNNSRHVNMYEVMDNVKYLLAPGLLSQSLQCRQDSQVFWEELQKGWNAQLWAAAMLDSSSSPLFQGSVLLESKNMGNYQKCVELDVKVNSSGTTIQGQFVTMRIAIDEDYEIPYRDRAKAFFGKPDYSWSETELYILTNKVSFYKGLCVPSSCTKDDIEPGLKKFTDSLVLIMYIESMTAREEHTQLPIEAKTVIAVLVLICIIIVTATICDYKLRSREGRILHTSTGGAEVKKIAEHNRLIQCFSLISNTQRFLSYRRGELDFFHGLRVLFRVWVTWGHHNTMIVTAICKNSGTTYKDYYHWLNQLWLNSPLGVNSFFFISGFFSCLGFFSSMKGKADAKSISGTVLKNYLLRYLRLTPLYAVVIIMFATVFPHTGGGPIWNPSTKSHIASCRENWHHNLLYTNGIEQDEGCLVDAWFMAQDMHFFLLAPLVLLPFLFSTSLGWFWIISVYIWSNINHLSYEYTDKIPFGKIFNKFRIGHWLVEELESHWDEYIVGLLTGCLYVFKPRTRLKQPLLLLLWCLSTLFSSFLILSGYQSHSIKGNEVPGGKSFGMAMHEKGWSLYLLSFVFLCSHGYGGLITPLLSWTPFLILSKLTYAAYVLSYPVRLWVLATRSDAIMFDNSIMATMILGELFIMFSLAFVFHLCIECPANGLIKLAQDEWGKPKKIKTG